MIEDKATEKNGVSRDFIHQLVFPILIIEDLLSEPVRRVAQARSAGPTALSAVSAEGASLQARGTSALIDSVHQIFNN